MLRPALLICVALSAFPTGTATADDPKVTLAALLNEYTDHGLPLPTKGAKLVKSNCGVTGVDNDGESHPIFALAFEMAPATNAHGPVLLIGTYVHSPDIYIVEEVKPEPKLLDVIEDMFNDDLTCAIQCHHRGWDELAAALFERSQKDRKDTPSKRICQDAWDYWQEQITQPKIVRTPAFRRLTRLMNEHKEFDTKQHRALLRSLESALQPTKAKPESVEALIDALVDDATDIRSRHFREENSEAYEKLATLGFEAVPALLEHLDDDRLTRGTMNDFNGFPRWNLRIDNRVSELIENLASEKLEHADDRDDFVGGWFQKYRGWPLKKSAAEKWWAAAQKVGEEAYLLSKVWPPKGDDERINKHALLVLRNKYPKQITSLFQTELAKGSKSEIATLAESVAKAKMTDGEKITLLLRAAEHRDLSVRYDGLVHLDKLDNKKFNAILLETLNDLPNDVNGDYGHCVESLFVNLAVDSDDPRVRSALEKAIARSSVGLKLEMLACIAYWNDKHTRTHRLRLLLKYFDDETVRDVESDERFEEATGSSSFPKIEVRNFATWLTAPFFGQRIESSKKRSPEEWAKLREQVRAKVKQELGDKK